MRILFVHREFPGQFGALADALAADPMHRVIFATMATPPTSPIPPPAYEVRRFRPRRRAAPTTHHYLRGFESDVLNGQAAFELCDRLRRSGFVPDVVYAHCGWGVMLYLKEAFPEARLVGYFEWYYQPRGGDAGFLDDGDMDPDRACRIRTLNAPLLMELADCDLGICPTVFQKQQFPEPFQAKLHVLHDGIDTDFFTPEPRQERQFGDIDLTAARRIVTYATRGMEPYRGFPQFMRAVDLVLKADPTVHVAIAGSDEVFYSRRLPDGESYRRHTLAALPDLDLRRVHFLGTLSLDDYRRLLRISDVHVYLTVPFVLSWSLLEAMACGCAIVASDTAPVRESITDGVQGCLVDFHAHVSLAERIRDMMADSALASRCRVAARSHALGGYRRVDLLPRQIEMLLGSRKEQLPKRTRSYG